MQKEENAPTTTTDVLPTYASENTFILSLNPCLHFAALTFNTEFE